MVKQVVTGSVLLALVVELDVVEVDTVTRCLMEFLIRTVISEPWSNS
jgi:ppGpp synthetase/RelA/SpoT-type nucleotidyltranferase